MAGMIFNVEVKNEANYLLNIALRGDGSIHPADQSTLQGFADLKD